jgi:hypothetical protein
MSNSSIKIEEGTEEIIIELSDEDLLKLSLLAHAEDITLNQYIVNALTEYAKSNIDHTIDSTDT